MEALEVLVSLEIFKNLPKDEIMTILPLINYKDFKKGSTVFMEGDEGKAVYFIRKGSVKLIKTSEEGKEIIINILSESDIFAEVTIFNDLAYPVTVQTLEDCQLGYIYNKDLETLVKDRPTMALGLIKILSKRLYDSQHKVKQIALKDVYHRTAQVLLKLNEREKSINIARQDLANMVGTARETLSRILSKLNKAGVISLKGKEIIVLEEEQLREY